MRIQTLFLHFYSAGWWNEVVCSDRRVNVLNATYFVKIKHMLWTRPFTSCYWIQNRWKLLPHLFSTYSTFVSTMNIFQWKVAYKCLSTWTHFSIFKARMKSPKPVMMAPSHIRISGVWFVAPEHLLTKFRAILA